MFAPLIKTYSPGYGDFERICRGDARLRGVSDATLVLGRGASGPAQSAFRGHTEAAPGTVTRQTAKAGDWGHKGDISTWRCHTC
jgi:hypothetical protein